MQEEKKEKFSITSLKSVSSVVDSYTTTMFNHCYIHCFKTVRWVVWHDSTNPNLCPCFRSFFCPPVIWMIAIESSISVSWIIFEIALFICLFCVFF